MSSSESLVWRDCLEKPFSIHGLLTEDGGFRRIPEAVATETNQRVLMYHKITAGGRIRFRTDSPEIGLRVRLTDSGLMAAMPLSGMSGCDIYAGSGKHAIHRATMMPCDTKKITADYSNISAYHQTVIPGEENIPAYEGSFKREAKLETITVNLPLYNGVKALSVGLAEDCRLLPPEPYTVSSPVIFYGSSITQGANASRPGLCYPAILSRMLDFDFRNLGFNSGARGEASFARYIASQPMSAFVMDYDYNAPDVPHLEQTHEVFFRIIREANPELPVLILSKPDFHWDPEHNARRRVIVRRTFENAVAAGDRHVWFVDGETLFGRMNRDNCAVDGRHPNDLGFMRMAECIYPVLKKALFIK